MRIHVVDSSFRLVKIPFMASSFKENHPPSPYTVDWQNPAPVPRLGPGSGSGPRPLKGAAPRGGAAATNGPGPDPDPGPGARFCQSTANPQFESKGLCYYCCYYFKSR